MQNKACHPNQFTQITILLDNLLLHQCLFPPNECCQLMIQTLALPLQINEIDKHFDLVIQTMNATKMID